MATKAADKLKASVARLVQSQQTLLDLRVWMPLQAIQDQLKAAIESARKLQVYRDQVEDHKKIIDVAFKEVEEDSREFTNQIEAAGVTKAQIEAQERERQARLVQVLAEPKEICTFSVGGHVFKIKKGTLLKSPNSRLVETMLEAEMRGGDLVVDRDPERFRHVLNFLRDDFKMPNLSVDKLAEVTDELRFWEVEQALQIGQDEEQKEPSPLMAELNALLSRDPNEDFPDVKEDVLKRWKDLSPLSVDEILAKAKKALVEGFPVVEKKGKILFGPNLIFKGQINPETKEPFGIGRYIFDELMIEGFFEGNEVNGWIRRIDDGWCYIGQMEDGYKHGQGKKVYDDGRIEEGQWEDGDFKG